MRDATKTHKRVFKISRALARPIAKWFFNYEYEPLPEIDGPILVLCNHNTDFDCGFVAIAVKRLVYFVATENMVRMGLWGKLLAKWFNPILHYKGSQGTATVKSILRRIKDGFSVCMFPEGNRSFNGLTCPIPPATGKMAKSCGATLVTYRLEGAYFTTPRWGNGIRKGKVRGVVAGVYPPETLREMSADAVIETINRDLYEDAYGRQSIEHIKFRGRKKAEGIESTLFMCPNCRKIGALKGKGDSLGCSCGYSALYTEEGYLQTNDGRTETITELDASQHEYVESIVAEQTGECLFEDRVSFRVVGEDHNTVSDSEATISAYPDRLEFAGEVLPYERIDSMSVTQRNLLTIHEESSSNRLEFTGDISFSALKYLYAYRAVVKSVNGVL